jgi:hypothetical protein
MAPLREHGTESDTGRARHLGSARADVAAVVLTVRPDR